MGFEVWWMERGDGVGSGVCMGGGVVEDGDGRLRMVWWVEVGGGDGEVDVRIWIEGGVWGMGWCLGEWWGCGMVVRVGFYCI